MSQQRTVSWSKEIDEQHVVEEMYDNGTQNNQYYNGTNDDYYDTYFQDSNNSNHGAQNNTYEDKAESGPSTEQLNYNNPRNRRQSPEVYNNISIRHGQYGSSTNLSSAVDDINNNTIRCPNCSSTAIEQHDASGSSICTECGVVVEENMIVSSVDFVEGAGGSASMVGHFVSATSTKAYTGSKRGGAGRYGYSRESREQTLQNARRRIQDVASRMRLGTQTVDAAHRLYVIALERNFVLGRKASHVTAACLYIACRQQKLQYMLIDFSDALQVNVFAIGTTFLKFRRMFGLKLELIDPALYIYRFAAHLDLDEAANTVAMTALRLVARMKRDWIQTGRRPAGICAAALLIAARAHGFQKEDQDVTKILRVCGMTVNTRVREFEQTASAKLTLEQFQDEKNDFEYEFDPPIFTRNRLMEARAKAIQEGNVELLESGILDDAIRSARSKDRWRNLQALQKKSDKSTDIYKALVNTFVEDDVNRKDDNGASLKDKFDKGVCHDDATSANDNSGFDIAINKLKDKRIGSTSTGTDQDGKPTDGSNVIEVEPKEESSGKELVVCEKDLGSINANTSLTVVSKTLPDIWRKAYPSAKYGKTLILSEHATAEEQLPSTTGTEGKISLNEWKQNMPKSVDIEVESMFRTDEEEKQKEAIFNVVNAEYIEQQKLKFGVGGQQRVGNDDDGFEDNGSGRGGNSDDISYPIEHHQQQQPQKRKYNTKRMRGIIEGVGTTEEQLMAAVSNRKVSRKINYDALSSIFDEDGSFSTKIGGGSTTSEPLSQSNSANNYDDEYHDPGASQAGAGGVDDEELDYDQEDETELFEI